MADCHSTATRSRNMSRVKNKDTSPELLVRKHLHSHGFRYRLHKRDLPGTPDIVLTSLKTVIFINGCFWHGHVACRAAALPKTRTEWWQAKIERNKQQDVKVAASLRATGWRILYVWSCQLKAKMRSATLRALVEELQALRQGETGLQQVHSFTVPDN